MSLVLIDAFAVPVDAREALRERSLISQNLVKTLPGFVEGYVHEQVAGDGPFAFVTTAVWEDEGAFLAARKIVADEYVRLGLDIPDFLKRHGITFVRGQYTRSPY